MAINGSSVHDPTTFEADGGVFEIVEHEMVKIPLSQLQQHPDLLPEIYELLGLESPSNERGEYCLIPLSYLKTHTQFHDETPPQ